MNLDTYWKNSGYVKLQKFYKYLKQQNVKITLKQVKEFLDKQAGSQITKKIQNKKLYSTIISHRVNGIYQLDIMVYNRNEYRGYKYVIGVIDVYSRFVMVDILKSRNESEYLPKLINIIKTMGIPENINCDNEFKTINFANFCSRNNITLWFSNSDEITGKNAIIERFWRTLAERIRDYRFNSGNNNWPSYINKIVGQYNSTIHNTIKDSPVNIFKGMSYNKQDIVFIKNKLKINDNVRIKLHKKTFEKGDRETFSRDIYKIIKKDDVKNNRWILQNIKTNVILKRGYLERDLQHITGEVIQPIKTSINPTVKQQQISTKRNLNKALKKLEIDATKVLQGKGGRRRKRNG